MAAREVPKVLASLGDDQEPVQGWFLAHLTNLTREEQEWLDEAWTTIPIDKRRILVSFLSESADADFALNFSAIFRRGLRDEDAEVRKNSVEGLWEDESVTLIRPFLAMLREDPDMDVRASAALGLGRFVYNAELDFIPFERAAEIVEALVSVANNAQLPVKLRRRAVEALGNSSDRRVTDIIRRAYAEPDHDMHVSAIFAMGRSADEQWAPLVRRELESEVSAFRFEAARAAGELSDRESARRLIELIAEPDVAIREVSIWSLGQIGGPAAKRALKAIIKGNNASLRQLARESLAEIALFEDLDATIVASEFMDDDEAGIAGGADAWEFDPLDDEPDDQEWDEDDLDEEWDDEDDDWDEEEDDLDDEWQDYMTGEAGDELSEWNDTIADDRWDEDAGATDESVDG